MSVRSRVWKWIESVVTFAGCLLLWVGIFAFAVVIITLAVKHDIKRAEANIQQQIERHRGK